MAVYDMTAGQVVHRPAEPGLAYLEVSHNMLAYRLLRLMAHLPEDAALVVSLSGSSGHPMSLFFTSAAFPAVRDGAAAQIEWEEAGEGFRVSLPAREEA